MNHKHAWYRQTPRTPADLGPFIRSSLRGHASLLPPIVEYLATGWSAIGAAATVSKASSRSTEACEAATPGYNQRPPANKRADRTRGKELGPTNPVKQVFTDYLQSLDPSGEPPDAESFDEVWSALDRALRSELKKRGLWESSPSYLGVYGFEHWTAGSQPGHGDALEELLADCYSHIFIRRLGSLKVQLKVKPNIEGLVFRGIRNFLHDVQKKHDPFGFRVFEILRSAIREALAAEELFVLAGDSRIRNDTALGFTPEVDPADLAGTDLKDIVRGWNDTLLPDLITANGKARQRLIADLQSLLSKLPSVGVDGFFFKQLIEPLKNDAGARWCALLAVAEGETAIESSDEELLSIVRMVQPDTSVEERDSFEKLSGCMAESLDRLRQPARTRAHLSTLWEFLRTYAADPKPDPQPQKDAVEPLSNPGRFPSARKLARLLRIPRDRLPELFQVVGDLVSRCLATGEEN